MNELQYYKNITYCYRLFISSILIIIVSIVNGFPEGINSTMLATLYLQKNSSVVLDNNREIL